MKSWLLEPKRSNGPSYLSLSRFKPLEFREKKLSPWCSPTPLEACVQLDRCPSYPSKTQEERERPELLERKRRRVPKTLTGVTKGAPLHSLSRPLFPLFLQVIRVADSPLVALPTSPASSNTRPATQVSRDLEVGVAASLLLPAGRNFFPIVLFLKNRKNTLLVTI